MLTRRAIFGSLVSIGGMPAASAEPALPVDEWRSFKSRFVSDDGRIVDNGNGGVSHSEGQGWGLLFAVAAEDQASFDLILGWTARVLRRPSDSLHAWRYLPDGTPPVPDLNNATDGDLFIACALIRAGRAWGRPDHLRAAAAIGHDILRLLVRRVGPLTVLLPGVQGFESKDTVVVNPSYYAFPMITEVANLVPSSQWDRLKADGRALIERGRFGRRALPPDWLQIRKLDIGLAPAPGWPPRFSYDAVRVPLWWLWQRLPAGPALESVRQFWSPTPANKVPAWVDLETDEVASYPATLGIIAIMHLIRLGMDNSGAQNTISVATATNYYDAALIMLSRIAERDMDRN
jgi:endoglucanase